MAREDGKRTAAAWAAGIIVGLLWLAMSVACLASSARGYANNRGDWGLAWGLIGVLLGIAGLASLVGTWWHQTRVLRGAREH